MGTPQTLTVCIETFHDEAGCVAWIENPKFKGMVVQANSLEATIKELLISLKVKFAYDYGIAIGGIEEKVIEISKEARSHNVSNCNGEQKISLGMSFA